VRLILQRWRELPNKRMYHMEYQQDNEIFLYYLQKDKSEKYIMFSGFSGKCLGPIYIWNVWNRRFDFMRMAVFGKSKPHLIIVNWCNLTNVFVRVFSQWTVIRSVRKLATHNINNLEFLKLRTKNKEYRFQFCNGVTAASFAFVILSKKVN